MPAKSIYSIFSYQLALIMVWLVVATSAEIPVNDTSTTVRTVNPRMEHKLERSCKALCEHCGCLGFYCGEECICECNNENSDTECIRTMQENAKQLDSPFEILIQGPSSNCFVRNALQFEQKRELTAARIATGTTRNRRSTITIYQPNDSIEGKRSPLAANALEPASGKKIDMVRHKRSVEHLDWFNDLAGSLVRPAPFGARTNQKREEKAVALQKKRQSLIETKPAQEPWFFQHAAPRLTRPAPRQQLRLSDNRRKNTSRKSLDFQEETSELKPNEREMRPFRDALQVVERIPRVFQETVNNLATDNNSGDVFSLNIMNDVAPKAVEQSKPKRHQIAVEVKQKKQSNPEPATLPKHVGLIPWLRERRLRRRQQLGLQ